MCSYGMFLFFYRLGNKMSALLARFLMCARPVVHFGCLRMYVHINSIDSMTIFQSLEGSDKSRVQGAISKILQVVGKDRMSNLKLSKLPTSVEEVSHLQSFVVSFRV